MSRFSRTEKIIFTSAVITLLIMSYFLYDDSLLFPKTRNGKLELIGKVSFSENDVRRKNYDNFSWVPASNKDQIFENDSIFTGERSTAEITLQMGPQIKVQPNSLITLNLKNGQMQLDLRYGNFVGKIKPGSSLTIRSGNDEYTLQNNSGSPEESSVEFTKSHNGEVGLKLLSGNINLVNKKGNLSKALTKDALFSLNQKGEMRETHKPEIRLTTLDNFLIEKEKPEDPIPFEWTSQGNITEYEVEVSTKEDFSVISAAQKTKELTAQITAPLPPGQYFWRLKALDRKGNVLVTSNTQHLTVAEKQIAKEDVPETPPSPPVLITKKVKFVAPSPEERAPASIQAPKVAWKPVDEVKSYQLQISKSSSFTSYQKYDVTQSQTLWSHYRPGKYYYRVVSRSETGMTSEPSDVGVMEISVGPLTLNPFKPITVVAKTPSIVEAPASWSEVPFAKSYLIELDKDASFSQAKKFEYTSTSGQLAITEPGHYQVRVKALDKDNNPLTEFSNIQEVVYDFRSPLDSPELTEPFNSSSIFLQTEMEPFIWLEWKAVENSISYTVEISDKPDFSRILIAKSINTNRYLVKDRVPLGKIYWRVRANAKDPLETSPWTDKREFTLYHQKNETFVK